MAAHHTGTDAELDALARDAQAIVREAKHVFREYPPFEGNTYTFIADYLPWANGDGMEHRNSTILTSPSSIRTSRLDLLNTIAHEFFHSWNVERIRPQSLEPFNLDDVNLSGELWLAEGFTSYYAPAGHEADWSHHRARVRSGHGRGDRHRRQQSGPVDSQRRGDEPDGAVRRSGVSGDRTNFANTFISYYTWGSVIGLGLDLTLRDRSDGRVYAGRLHARALGEVRPPGHAHAGIRRDALHDRQPEVGACRGGRRRGVCRGLLRALHPGPRGRGLQATARQGGLHPATAFSGACLRRSAARRRMARAACA